ncbi:HPP family protein [Paracoccus sp. MC1854]|uniref:HPP family protein n=1 Tax=Paracoccus sp. MC1854 TaxID=2760306 RepID=UPI0016006DA5|nr:HPP family protein [Paracoccus sp. MC1854]
MRHPVPPAAFPTHSRLRALGPTAAAVPAREALRAGLGATLGLAVTAACALAFSPDLWLGIYLIAPFGASSVLLFAAPNSPLAQPWPAIVGNTVAALTAILVCRFVSDPRLCIPLAVGLAIVVMALCRATHPPGGAVAMTVALGAERIAPLGLGFALLPVATGTAILVVVAALYARATGRRYPLRQFHEPNPNGTADPPAIERLGLTEDELSHILVRYRQSLNLGVEDLARLVAAAEIQAASHRTDVQTAADIMSRDLVTVGPRAPLREVAELFTRHGFTSLPVVEGDGRFLGIIFQLHLIASDWALADSGFRKLLPRRGATGCAADVMQVAPPSAAPDSPIAALLPHLATHRTDAVPILDGNEIVGIVTQTDLIAALARQSLRAEQAPA